MESDIRPKLKTLIDGLFSSIPTGVGSEGPIKLTSSELDELLVEGAKWSVENGYGINSDLDSCEESGKMNGADPINISNNARKRGSLQLGSSRIGESFP